MIEPFTILIIDDNVTLARGFAQGLTNAGYRVHLAHTAEDGLLFAQGERPDAIILDMRMPFVNGVGFLYRLRELAEHAQTPVMVLTGESVNEETRAEIEALGGVLRFKPLGLSDLLKETRALVPGKQEH
jgi:DNA-binding response OmpR family regulator